MNLAKPSTALHTRLQTGGIYCLLFSQQVSECEKNQNGLRWPTNMGISYGNLYVKRGLQSHNNGLQETYILDEQNQKISQGFYYLDFQEFQVPNFGLQSGSHPKPSLSLCIPMTNSHMDELGQDAERKAGQRKAKQGTGDSNPGKVLNVQSQQHLGAHS